MSHSNTMEQTLLKSIDDYIDHGNSVYEMHQIAHYLNMQPTITSEIHAKFYVLLNEMDYTKIKKTLDLIEYLTVFSPPKIPQLVNDDKFMEYISQILMEHYLQDQTLNLLRLWADEYNDSREDLDKVFMLIENLEAFELQLPLSYHSQFKAAGAGVPAAAGNRPEQNAMMPEESGLSGKARDLINKSKEVIENMKKVLEAQNFEEMSREFKKNKLQLLLSQNLSASSDLSEQKTSETSSEVKQKIDTAIKELKSYRTKLQEKLDVVENKAGVAGPQNKPHQGPIQGPQNQPHNQPHNPPQNAADGYKIVVSATDNQGHAAQAGSQTMEVEELLNYKVQQCQEGAVCSHAPPQNVQVPMQTSYNSTMHCPCWHVREDRRRPVYDQMNRSVYNFGICANSQACPKGDSCGFSHNFFEHLYHPLNYKKKECIAGKGCRNGKYCPYYHSQEEKKAWNSIAKEYFDAAPDEENENLLEETNKHMREVSNWRDTVREEDYPSYNPNSDDDLEDYGYKKYKAPAAADLESNEPLKPSYGQGYVHDTNYNNEKAWYAKEEEKQGTLHSKLVIRKKYENPDILSKLFQKSTVFSGLPFCGQYSGMSGEKKVEGGEEDKEKQN